MSEWFSRPPKALLLDIDNTVYSYEPCHVAGLNAAFAQSRYLKLWNDERLFHEAYGAARETVKSRIYMQAAGHSRLLYFKEMIEALLGFTSFEQTCRLEQAYWEGFASHLTPDPECQSVLQEAAAAGIRMAWVSNFTTARQMWKLKRLGLDGLKSLLVTSEEAGADKPNPAVLDLALQRLGVNRRNLDDGEAWFVGDEPADVDVASSRQLPILLLCRKCETKADGAKLPVSNWNQIGEVLRNARN